MIHSTLFGRISWVCRVLGTGFGALVLAGVAFACESSRTAKEPEPVAEVTAAQVTAAEAERPALADPAAADPRVPPADPADPKKAAPENEATAEAPRAADSASNLAAKGAGESGQKSAAVGQGKASAPAAEEATAAPAPPRRGSVAQGEGFSAWIEAQGSYKAGSAATAQVVLSAKAPYKCNDKYPYKFKLTPTDGLTFPNPAPGNMQIGAERCTLTVPFTPSAQGQKTLSGELSFSVCTEEKCLIEKQQLSVQVDVPPS